MARGRGVRPRAVDEHGAAFGHDPARSRGRCRRSNSTGRGRRKGVRRPILAPGQSTEGCSTSDFDSRGSPEGLEHPILDSSRSKEGWSTTEFDRAESPEDARHPILDSPRSASRRWTFEFDCTQCSKDVPYPIPDRGPRGPGRPLPDGRGALPPLASSPSGSTEPGQRSSERRRRHRCVRSTRMRRVHGSERWVTRAREGSRGGTSVPPALIGSPSPLRRDPTYPPIFTPPPGRNTYPPCAPEGVRDLPRSRTLERRSPQSTATDATE